jgi:membrane glycosyltransferase
MDGSFDRSLASRHGDPAFTDLPPAPLGTAATADLPAEQPMAMPIQDLDAWTGGDRKPASTPMGLGARRAVVFILAAVLALAADYGAWDTFAHDGLTPMEGASLLLFATLSAGISVWFCSSLAGFTLLMRGGADDLGLTLKGEIAKPATRSAILAPVRNEDPRAVFARLRAMDASLARLGVADRFDFFVLSDTNDAAVALAEQAELARIRRANDCPIYYRRRLVNTERKTGNIADWVRRFGAGYETMVVLDADSLMTGETIVRLVGAIEANPAVGVIQTMPAIAGGETLFARWLQFCTRLYGQVAAAGLSWWTGSESVYWGHNAAIRVRAFAQSAGLPQINRPGVFGGAILSHDAIESALLRRNGWGVHLAPMLDGSYEEAPPTLLEFAIRDRRWCQGNVQHLPLLKTPGFHWVSRFQLFIAIMGYLTSPIWLAFMTIGLGVALASEPSVAIAWQQTAKSISHGWTPPPNVLEFIKTIWLLGLTSTLLMGPKFMGVIYILASRQRRKSFGGGRKLLVSLVVELFVSTMLAPLMMVTQTRAVLEIVCGRDAGWTKQERSADGMRWRDAFKAYRWHMLVGLALAGSVSTTPALVLWMLPVAGPLLFSPLLAHWTSGMRPGAKARANGLFLIPEETRAPPIIRRARLETVEALEPQGAVVLAKDGNAPGAAIAA